MAAKPADSTQVAVLEKNMNMPVGFEGELEGITDLGFSEKAEDTLVPIVAILQDNSAEVKRQHAKFIDGSQSGDLIIRSFKKTIRPTKQEPLLVQPAGFQHMWVQWDGEPGEGKVVNQYPFDDRPADAVEKIDPNDKEGKRTFWAMPDGTRLVDTRYHYCNALIDGAWIPVVIPMAGTNHSVSKQWTGQMKSAKINGRPMPAWFRKYALSTAFQQRGAQSWYTYSIDDLGWIEERELRDMGRSLNESMGFLTAADEPIIDGTATQDDNSPV